MSGSSRFSFYGISRAVFSRLCRRASKLGLRISRSSGEAEKDGVRIQWSYDASNEALEVECVHVPFWFNVGRINRELSSEIEATLRSNRAA